VASRLPAKSADNVTPAQAHTYLTHIAALEHTVDTTARAWEQRPRQQVQVLAAQAAEPGRALARAVLRADLGQLVAAARERLEVLMGEAGVPIPLPRRRAGGAGGLLPPAAYAKKVVEAAVQARKAGDPAVQEALLTRLGKAYAMLPPPETPEQVARVIGLVADLILPRVRARGPLQGLVVHDRTGQFRTGHGQDRSGAMLMASCSMVLVVVSSLPMCGSRNTQKRGTDLDSSFCTWCGSIQAHRTALLCMCTPVLCRHRPLCTCPAPSAIQCCSLPRPSPLYPPPSTHPTPHRTHPH
jgi:hypothetical protein